MANRSLKHIPEIDGLRALAIILVIIWHYGNNLLQGAPWPWAKYAVLLTNQTWSGVDLFFVLSGFLITGILLKNLGSSNYFKTFYIRRLYRIFPIYYLMVIIFTMIKGTGLDIGNYLLENDTIPVWSYFLHIQNFFMAAQDSFGSHFLGVSWSLAIEEQFYLILPLLVLLTKPQVLKYALPLSILIGIIFRIWTTGYTQLLLLPARIDGLMIGATIAFLYRFHQKRLIQISILALWICIVVILGITLFMNIRGISIPGGNILPISVIYGLLLVQALQLKKTWFNKLLTNNILSRISRISYGIYLYHVAVLGLVFKFTTNQAPSLEDGTDALLVLLSVGITYLVAHLSFTYIEQPLIRKGHQYEY
jgi:peptidoglycan/LPS O-acetylase OafA/YrhL